MEGRNRGTSGWTALHPRDLYLDLQSARKTKTISTPLRHDVMFCVISLLHPHQLLLATRKLTKLSLILTI
jgi:hypothetical protein